MTTKLSSELSSVIEKLEAMKTLCAQLDIDCEGWKARALKAEQLICLADFAEVSKIIKAAEDAGISPKEWIAEKLSEACEPKTELPIDGAMFQRFQELAVARGISLSELGKGVEFTEILRDVFENMRL